MKRTTTIDLSENKFIERLKILCPPSVYNTESEIIYEGHVPTAGYLLIEGEIHFLKRKRVVETAKGGSLFGISELMNHTALNYTVRIQPGSKVCILDKSTIKELLNSIEESYLPDFLKDLVA